MTNSENSGKIKAESLSRYVNSSDRLYEYLEKVPPLEGYEDQAIHCDGYTFELRDKDGNPVSTFSPREFAEILREDPNYHGGDIRLLACSSGKYPDGAAFMLANQLGVNVLAPTEKIWVDPDGKMTIGNNPDDNDGTWTLFKPLGGKRHD